MIENLSEQEKVGPASVRGTSSLLVTADHLEQLPAPVQRYMIYTGIVGKPWIETVRVKYVGKFRMALDKPWMSMNVNQVYTTNTPGFLWKASFKVAGLPLLLGSDIYKAGHSHMNGKLMGLFTVVDGAAMRWISAQWCATCKK